MHAVETPGDEPKPKETPPKMCEPGKLDGDRPIESAIVTDPEPNPPPPPGAC